MKVNSPPLTSEAGAELPAVDSVMPAGRWQFNDEVTNAFEDMLARSIPQYEVMRQAVYELARRFAAHNTTIVDLGCSRGDTLQPLVNHFGVNNRFIGVEVSEPMIEAARTRFSGYIKANVVDIRKMDLRYEFPPVKASVVLSILTLQFTPIEYRLQILRRIYDSLLPGGAFILVEKIIGSGAVIDDTLVDCYLNLKADHGYSREQIERKRMALEGVLVPVTAAHNEEMLKLTGFQQVDCFWRWMNFAGWLGLK